MIYVYRSKGSDSAKLLAETLEGLRVRGWDGTRFVRRRDGTGLIRPHRGDVVVCWGEHLVDPIDGVRVLNGGSIIDKFQAAIKLKEAGVPTVEVSTTRPAPIEPPTFGIDNLRGLNVLNRVQAVTLAEQLQRFLSQPVVPLSEWLARTFNHVGGHDLLHPPTTPDYWSKKENLVKEYRIHCFNGKSIRAGVKVHRDGMLPHEWVRSLDGGWRIRYDEFSSNKVQRALAAEACKALGLEFGAVDIGEKAGGGMVVLEVNRAPGLGDGTVMAYAAAIGGWSDEA